MKSKCSFILKTSVALLLAILMVFGSVSTVIAAVVDVSTGDQSISTAAKKGLDIAGTAANADLVGTGDSDASNIARVLFVGVPTGWNSDADTPNTVIHTYYAGGSGTDRNVTYTGLKSDDNKNYIYVTDSYTSKEPRFGAKRSDNGWYGDNSKSIADYNIVYIWYDNGLKTSYTTYQLVSTASLSATKTSMTTAESSTLTPSLASNATYNVIKSTTYEVTTNPGSGGSVTSEGVFTATKAGTYIVTATVTYNAIGYTNITKTATATKQITVTSASTPLAAPKNVKIDNSSSDVTVDASPSANSTLSWSSVSNATSYEIYKGGTKVGTSNTTSYSIARKNSNGGTYTVKAVPSSSSYSTSAASSGIKLTVNKVTLTAPTVVPDKTDVVSGTKVTYTLTDNNTVGSSYYSLQSATTSNGTYSDISGTTKEYTLSANSSGDVSRYFKATVKSDYSDYFTTSNVTTSKVYVSASGYYMLGLDGNWSTSTDAYQVKNYEGNNVFSYTISNAAANTYFGLITAKSSGTRYQPKGSTYSTPCDVSTCSTQDTAKEIVASPSSDEGSFKISTAGTYVVYVDQTNKKVWVTQNTWAIAASAYTQTYDVATGTYKTATASTTGGTVSPASTNVKKGSPTTLKATPASGYTFDGWYKATTFTSDNKVSTNASYTFTPFANGTYYALFKQNEPAKVNISVANVDNATITAKWNNQTKTNGQSLTGVPVGASVTVTVTPASGYYVTGNTPTLTNGKFTVTSTTTSISATVAKNATIKPVTNKSSRGTVSVDKTSAHKDDVIKITVTPLAGTLKSLTANYANGAIYTYNLSTSKWDITKEPTSVGTGALEAVFLNPLKTQFNIAATGADLNDAAIAAMPDIVPVGAASTINMTMAYTSDVTINATFDTYSGESTWYYNGYDTSGNAVSGYHGRQMTESYLGGELFSYYHVQGRTGTVQLMTVSNGAASSGTRYVYFTASSEGGWSTNDNHQYAYFYNNNGTAGEDWPGYKMTKYTTNDYGQNVFRVEIPTSSSPTGVVFNNATNANHKTTNVTDLTKGGYYLLTTHHNDNGTEIHDWQSYDCTYPNAGYSSGTEYFYGSDNDASTIYSTDNNGKSIFGTTGFYRHGASSKNYAKPRLTASDTGDYYVNVLYPGKTYTINGVTKTIGNDGPVVIWSKDPLAGDDENVTVYAKDGAIRAETFGSTYANIADTKIYAANGTSTVGTKHSGSITNQTYETYKAAKGDTLVIKTQIGATDSGNLSNADALKAKYYVRGFCVNGEVSELLEWKSDGLYTLTYKIPEDTEITKFEITPIYYLKDTTAYPIVTYRVTGFTDELKAVGTGKPGWGDTLYTYPYYGKLGGDSNAFGAYPGQPMVYYKGQYQMQIPQKSTTWVNTTSSNTTVSGVTMSNGYWDSVHKSIMGYGDNSTSADHVQTYDYGDFYKIFNEKKPVDNIVFDFKYRTKKHNLVNDNTSTSIAASTLTSAYGTNGNGFEMLTNFHGKNVDLFGNPLSGDAADPSKTTPIYVVSIGGVNENGNPQYGVENIAGYYATEWRVYAPNDLTSLSSTYKKVTVGSGNTAKSSIPPEVLVLNNDDSTSFNTSTYPSADTNHNVTDWQAMYTELKQYAGHPVMISYEAADAQQGQGMYYTGTGGATRNDGRWLYSKTGENITSTIKIQYSDDNGDTYTDLNTTTPQVSGLSAYFTNDGVEGQMTYSTTIDPDKTFDFEAKTTNGNYKFVGWYMKDGTKITSDNASHTERSGSYTFVAKFMKVESGQLILSHSVDTNTTYKGAGTAKISAVVKDGEEVIRTYDLSTSDITLDDKIIKSDSSYSIDVTLEATATGNDTYGTTTLANPSDQASTYFTEKSSSIDGKKKTIVLNSFTVASLFSGTTQNVKNIIYHSYFHQTKFDYQLTFIYKDRFNVSKSFTRKGQLTSAQVANTNYVKQSEGSFTLRPAFILTVAPYESNFGEDITWDINDVSFTKDGSDYTCTAEINSTRTQDTKRNVTFVLPYQHTNGIANGGNKGTAAETTNFDLKGDNAVTFDTIPTLLNNGVNGIYDEDIKKNWIAAPAELSDNGTTKYFQYWSVKRTSAHGENDPEVARCYFQGFNFCALDNYTVTAVYGNEATDISTSGIYTGVSYLETSRNQWNDNQDRTKSQGANASDLLFNDFILNYNFKGVDIYRDGSDTDDIQELGVVVERVQELGINQDGSKDTDISHYTSIDENRSTVEAVINGTSSDKKFTKDAIAKTALDNKNRIKFYEAFYNGKGWNMLKQSSDTKYAYKNYVYRAYTYIKYTNDQGQPVIQLSAKPAYFTMYDEAVADYVAPTTNTSGN